MIPAKRSAIDRDLIRWLSPFAVVVAIIAVSAAIEGKEASWPGGGYSSTMQNTDEVGSAPCAES